MLGTVAVTVGTHDLAKGVLVGVLLSGFFFAHKIGQILLIKSVSTDEGRAREYTVLGQVFFASAERFSNAFDYKEAIDKVRIDVSRAHFWDISAIGALDSWRSASSKFGYCQLKPASCARRGSRCCPPNSNTDISPKANLSAKAGIGNTAGRCRASAKARVNSRLRTAPGAQAL